METLVEMSTKEFSRLGVMQKLSEKHMSQKETGEILHLGKWQIKQLLKSYRKQGAADLSQNTEVAKGITICWRA
jgi:hypothetical protein